MSVRSAMSSNEALIHTFIDDAEAVRLLAKYHADRYTGSRVDAEAPAPRS